MSENIEPVLTELTNRLPELEWQLNQVNWLSFFNENLPNTLFRCGKTTQVKAYIEEIRYDIANLANQTYESNTQQYLADTIRRKINTLVKTCQLTQRSNTPVSLEQTFITRLMSRQQQLNELESKIQDLERQQAALSKTLSKTYQTEMKLSLQAELGKLEKLLTLARETWTKMAGMASPG